MTKSITAAGFLLVGVPAVAGCTGSSTTRSVDHDGIVTVRDGAWWRAPVGGRDTDSDKTGAAHSPELLQD